jgi:endonuclease/exonuclease/phosphatase family metal-dependent hydrolase
VNGTLKKILIYSGSIILILALLIGGYVGYVMLQYSRYSKIVELKIDRNSEDVTVSLHREYTISTYNIGFGAYNHDYSFFMDEGYMNDGTYVKGKYAKARSKDIVLNNTNGAINTIKNLSADFMLFQEVDKKANRSYKVNQYQMLMDGFSDYSSVYASNFHTAYLLYPFNDPIGKTEAGIVTLSKYNIKNATRYKLPIDESFPAKFFDLDRCFMVTRYVVNGDKELVLINVHLSAYDEGGVYRKKQLQLLNDLLKEEREKNNYVIVGGDFNHDIADSLNTFATEQKVPGWVYVLTNEDLTHGYSFATSKDIPTCRSTDMAYVKDSNYSVVIDGFIVSDNIMVNSVTNIAQENDELFLYSDHNPVEMNFVLM